ncbi:MAG TPA: CARDB domain-containing protein [Thermoplasmata archaeon]|nr:CARDB domain-containing protein [Thermoplasmata archaeon]
MSARALALVLIVLAVAVVAVPAAVSADTGPLFATITGPTALAPSQTAVYNVTITGGPTGNTTYALNWQITGTNTSGGNPVATSPGSTSGNRTSYRLNVTAPTLEQSLTLTVTVVATPKVGTRENVTTTFAITVLKGIVLAATFHNSGTTAAENVTVRWYIDGTLVGTSILKSIAANGDATVTFTYLPVGLSPGQHTLTVSADLDHDGIIDPARGETVTSTIFYSQVQQPASGWAILLAIGVFIPVFLGVVAWRRRGER